MRARLEWKLMYQLVPLAVVIGLWGAVALGTTVLWLEAPQAVRANGVLMLLETGLPLLALFAFGHAATVEWEERTAELTFTYPSGGTALLAFRLLVALATYAGMTVVAVTAFSPLLPEMLHSGPANGLRLVGLATPPAVFVGAVGLVGSVIGRHYAVGLTAGLVPWGLDLVFRGRVTRCFYLFEASRPAGRGVLGVSLAGNRALLLAGAVVLLGLVFIVWNHRARAVL